MKRRPAKKSKPPKPKKATDLGQGRTHRSDPVHARFNYDAHRRTHPVERLVSLRRQLDDALKEVIEQSSTHLRGSTEQLNYEFAMQAAATHVTEITGALVFLMATLMQKHPHPWKLTPYERQ